MRKIYKPFGGRFRAILLFSVLFCVWLTTAMPASAQSLSLSLWPPLLEVMIQPGRSVTQVYKLTNASDHELQITPQIFSFKPQGENGEIQIKFSEKKIEEVRGGLKEDKGDTSEKFFSFESGEQFNQPFYLPIGKEREITLKISPPKDTPENDYYYTLLFSTATPTTDQDKNSSSSTAQIGTNILITVSQNGAPNFLARILEFSCPKIIDSFSPVNFTVRLENWGNAFWKPFGKISLTGILKQKEEIELWPQNVLAQSSRKLDVPEFRPGLPLGPFKALLEFSPSESSPSANLSATEKLSMEITFWYLPYKALAALVALLLAVFFIRKVNHKLKPYWEILRQKKRTILKF